MYDLVRFCGTQQREHASEEYLTALRQIAALDVNLEAGTTGVDITIPVKIVYNRSYEATCDVGSRKFAKTLTGIAQAEKQIQVQWETLARSSEVESGALRCTFVLQPMYVGFDMMELTQEVAEVLENLLADGVWLTASHMLTSILRESPDHELEARQALGQLLRQLFASTRRDAHISYHLGPDSRDQDRQLVLPATMPASDFETMCSAMMLTQTTKSLSLSTDETIHEHRWKWLAYTLFSKRSHSSVKKLTIHARERPTAAEARAFASILTSEHPEEDLFGTPRGVVGTRIATLRSGAPIKWEFDDEGQPVLDSQPLTLETPIPFVRTFSDDGESEWINVLVPGFGRCQVQRYNLDFECAVENPSSCITTLAIEAPETETTSAEGLLPFIESIGFALTSLTLNGPQRAEIDENAIIRCCPNLQELSLARELMDVQLDFSDYRATNTPVPELAFAWRNVNQFVDSLASTGNPLTKCVRRLRVDQRSRSRRPNGNPANLQNELKAILRMLRVNERLEYWWCARRFNNFPSSSASFTENQSPGSASPYRGSACSPS